MIFYSYLTILCFIYLFILKGLHDNIKVIEYFKWEAPKSYRLNGCDLWCFFMEGEGIMLDKESQKEKRKKLINQVLNHNVPGEVFILTKAYIWKPIVLNHFNKIQRGEMTITQLMEVLEKKYGVKYGQKHSLVRYPIEEYLKYIAKIAKTSLDTE